jgi:hypothetical protein
MSELVKWASKELDHLNKVGEEDSSATHKNILDVVKLFAEQNHTGFTAPYSIDLIKRLLAWKPITPLTGEDDEWGPEYRLSIGIVQQNHRCSGVFRYNHDNSTAHYIEGKVFSDDGGETWFSQGKSSSVPVTFPFMVPLEPEYILINKEEE